MTIVKDFDYTTGVKLDVDGHNDNVYSTSVDHGIMSTANGRIGASGLPTGFECEKEHVWPGEVFRGHQDFQYETAHYFSDVASESATELYIPVAGCALRVYMPYDVTFALWQWSFHFSCGLPQIDQPWDGDASDRVEPIIRIKASYDGTELEHTRRQAPLTAYILNSPGTSFETKQYENYLSRPYDMAHMVTSVSAGWHEIQLNVYMENFTDEFEFVTVLPGPTASTSIAHDVFSRASFGIRNARVLTVL